MSRLAFYYDALVKDMAAAELWLEFTKQHGDGEKVLELAGGTGEISRLLAQAGYSLLTSDIDEDMLEINRSKNHEFPIRYKLLDMRDFLLDEKFETIVCYCDSVNYLIDEAELQAMFTMVVKHLSTGGVFLFDIHSQERIEEFSEPFIEEGELDGVQYQWAIESSENKLYHHFFFWEDNNIYEEMFTQTVFTLEFVCETLLSLGFSVKIYTDFSTPGITAGERYCLVARKE